jgi:hypothetical protein
MMALCPGRPRGAGATRGGKPYQQGIGMTVRRAGEDNLRQPPKISTLGTRIVLRAGIGTTSRTRCRRHTVLRALP